MHKRIFLGRAAVGLFTCLVAVAAPTATAQTWPAKPVRILVSFAPGGLTDLIARALQPKLQEGFGQPVVIENRPGAGGTLAEGMLSKSVPDGYTILLSADSVSANPHLVPKLPYDTFNDLLPVAMLARIPLVMLVNNNVPAGTVKDFVAYAKTREGSYGSPGIGTSNHLYFEVFKASTGIDWPHVAYKGGGPAMTDLIGGHVQALLISSTLAVPQASAEKVKALAVTSEKRLPKLPNVPTFAEAGFADFKPQQWQHVALYNEAAGRIEMHLQSRVPQRVSFNGGQRDFAAAERIHTENSYKWRRSDFEALLRDAGFARVQTWTDAQGWYAVMLAQAA